MVRAMMTLIAPKTMSAREFGAQLHALRLPFAEAAQLLGVSERSVRRWTESEEVPGTAAAAVRAWRHLDDHHLPWKPDAVSIFQDDQEQIRRMRDHSGVLCALIEEVEAAGGPANQWVVDIPKRRARTGHAEVSFYMLRNGGFSPSTYRRLDGVSPKEADRSDARDASYCIAQAFAKTRAANKALIAVAEYTTQHANVFVRDGAALLSPDEVERRTRLITGLAVRVNDLALAATDGEATYAQFEAIIEEMRTLGFYPAGPLVSDVARHMFAPPTLEMILAAAAPGAQES